MASATPGAQRREIGLVYYQLDQHEAAADAFEAYLKMRPNAQGADEVRAYVERVRG